MSTWRCCWSSATPRHPCGRRQRSCASSSGPPALDDEGLLCDCSWFGAVCAPLGVLRVAVSECDMTCDVRAKPPTAGQNNSTRGSKNPRPDLMIENGKHSQNQLTASQDPLVSSSKTHQSSQQKTQIFLIQAQTAPKLLLHLPTWQHLCYQPPRTAPAPATGQQTTHWRRMLLRGVC